MILPNTMELIMDCKKVSFKGFNIYNATSYVQDHTLVNRGITTLGGSTAPQCIMSNNKYEAQERALMGGIYFVASYLTPILLIPLYNKHFLKNKGITKALEGAGNKIIEVSKQYLTPDADILKGLHETAKRFDKADDGKFKKAFDEIYNRYNNPDKLKKDLLSVHQKVLTTDFITTAMMWSAIPWIATEFTEYRTKRHDFSAGFNLKENSLNDKNDVKKSKIKKALWNVFFTTVPAVVFAKTVTRGIGTKSSNKILKTISENAQNFDYTSGTNMSKTIYAAIWLLSSFPAKIISSRDANERKDRALRDAGLFTMFFGGDFLINNISGRLADKFLGTRIMNGDSKDLNFFQRFKLQLRNFRKLDEAKDLPPEILKKTKSVGAGLYWFALLSNTALIGFGLPKVLNKFLRHNIDKEKENLSVKNANAKAFTGISMNDFVKQ